jgi:hypothetical protein
MTRCESSLNCNDSKAIRLLILSLIDLKIIKNGREIYQFFELTLYFIQKNDDLKLDYIFDALNYLIEMRLVLHKNSKNFEKFNQVSKEEILDHEFEITKLGIASIKCGIDLDWLPKLYVNIRFEVKTTFLFIFLFTDGFK